MRKLLFALVLFILLVVSILFIVKGISNSNFAIYGVNQIKAKNAEIDIKNEKLATLVNQDYPIALKNVESASAQMKKTKEEYEEKAALLGNSKYYMQTEEYKLEFLWTKLGNYADDEDVDIKIDVTNSQMAGRYNLNFTVTGAYTDVTQFIYDVENDSKLGFKIENFEMVSDSSKSDDSGTKSDVIGTFSCKDIKIDLKDIQSNENSEEKDEDSKKETSNSTSEKNSKTNTTSSSKSTNTNTTKNSNTTVDDNTTKY